MDPKVIAAVKPLLMRVNQGINHALAACEGFKVMINSLNHALEEKSRSIWAHERNGVFWEKDVPNMPDGVFKSVFRLERTAFDMLVQALSEMAKKDTNFRNCIPLQKRVAIAAFAMGSASEYFAIAWMFGVSTPNVYVIVKEFCRLVWQNLAHIYLGPNFLTQARVGDLLWRTIFVLKSLNKTF